MTVDGALVRCERDGWRGTGQVSVMVGRYLVEEGLVEGSVLPFQLVDLLIELCLYVGALHLEILQGVDAPLHHLGEAGENDTLRSCPQKTRNTPGLFPCPSLKSHSLCHMTRPPPGF